MGGSPWGTPPSHPRANGPTHSSTQITKNQHGLETAYTVLPRDTETPYIDTRENLTAGPETRRYRARYLQKDTTVGDYSDVLVVTVPGKS